MKFVVQIYISVIKIRTSRNFAFTLFKLKYASRAFKFATVLGSVFSGIQIRNKIIQFSM